MTDYLEEGPGQGEALLQALEAMVLWIPVPDGRTAEADGGTSLPATDLCIQGSFVSPADRREPDREDAPGSSTGAEAPLIRGGREDGEEALPLLSVLLERERAAAALNEIRTAQEASRRRPRSWAYPAPQAIFPSWRAGNGPRQPKTGAGLGERGGEFLRAVHSADGPGLSPGQPPL